MSRPLRDHTIAWDFDQHKASGKLGGDDLLTFWGERIESPVTGRLTYSGGTASIREADGWRTILLHLKDAVGARSRDVVEGEIIAIGGEMWVHAHQIKPGDSPLQHTRARWLPSLDPAGGTGTPIPADPIQESDMLILRTSQHGIYTVAPGAVVSHVNATVSSGLEYRGKAQVMDVAPESLVEFIFGTSGCPAGSIPAPGYIWLGSVGVAGADDDAAVLAALERLGREVAAADAALSAQIAALDSQADNYQDELERLSQRTLTGTITLTPTA